MDLGKMNTLEISRDTDIGLFLKDSIGLEVFLPNRYKPENYSLGDNLEVFVYHDNEGRAISTTDKPIATVNDFAYLKCKESSDIGAFMDLGIDKDMFIPKRNQHSDLIEGQEYLVWIYLDELTNRLVATTKLNRLLSEDVSSIDPNQKVELLIWQTHDLGWQVIVDGSYYGMLYSNQCFVPVLLGSKMIGYVTQIREDGRLDILLQKPGYASIDEFSDKIISKLQAEGGEMSLTDKSSPEAIYTGLEMSKKAFKKAIGTLYKKRLITLNDNSISLVKLTYR
jgi:predicted RNA-binding protein (virulence factor B family)